MPVIDNPNLQQQIATIPDNTTQPPRFGGITELVKDAFVLELRHYLNTSNALLRGQSVDPSVTELPRIAKYSVLVDTSTDPLETAVALIRNYPDIAEDLPLIAVLATTGKNEKLAISDKYIANVVAPAQVIGTTQPPYALTSGMTLEVQTMPDGQTPILSTYTFNTWMFADITHATLTEVINAINLQALYVQPFINTVGSTSALGLRPGNKGLHFPNMITVVGGTAAPILGFPVAAPTLPLLNTIPAQASQNYGAGSVVMKRYHIAASLSVALEVVAESENVRTDITDLLFDFLTFVMADREFQLYGRSVFDQTILDETYQIIIKDNDITLSGEQELPRFNDPKDKIYINRINVPVLAIQYTDRIQNIVPPNKPNITISVNPVPVPS
jgi:hypothetical protein